MKGYLITFLFIFWTSFAYCQTPKNENVKTDSLKSPKAVEKLFNFADKSIDFLTTEEWIFIPALVYSPETNLGLGVRAMRVFNTDPTGNTRPSTLPITFLRTLNKQTLLTVEWESWGKENKHQFHSRWEFHDFPFRFYGIGNLIDDDFENYASKILYGHVQYHKKIHPVWFVGPRVEIGAQNVYQRESGGVLDKNSVPGASGYFLWGGGMDFILDSRDQIFQPTEGWFSKLSFISYQRAGKSVYSYSRYTVDLRKYISIKNQQVLAIQSYLDGVVGTAPFQRLPMIGGSDLMRGYFEGKYRGQSAWVNQLEYRFPVYRNLGMVMFTGLGQVQEKGKFQPLKNQRLSGGIGFRYRLNKEGLNVRLDIGYGDQRAFYFGLREVI
jgi:hypothetical protein